MGPDNTFDYEHNRLVLPLPLAPTVLYRLEQSKMQDARFELNCTDFLLNCSSS